MKRWFVFLFLLFCAVHYSFAQTDSLYAQRSIGFGFGLGAHGGDTRFDSGGTFLTLGYEYKKNARLRYSYSASLMSSNFNTGSGQRPMDFKSISLRAIGNYDVLRKRRFSFFAGIGPVINLTTGTAGGDFNGPIPIPAVEDTIFDVGLGLNVGIRFEPKTKDLGFEFVPFNAHVHTSRSAEAFLQFRFFKVF